MNKITWNTLHDRVRNLADHMNGDDCTKQSWNVANYKLNGICLAVHAFGYPMKVIYGKADKIDSVTVDDKIIYRA